MVVYSIKGTNGQMDECCSVEIRDSVLRIFCRRRHWLKSAVVRHNESVNIRSDLSQDQEYLSILCLWIRQYLRVDCEPNIARAKFSYI